MRKYLPPMRFNVYAMIRYKFESNSQQRQSLESIEQNVYAMIRYKFESNSQHAALLDFNFE